MIPTIWNCWRLSFGYPVPCQIPNMPRNFSEYFLNLLPYVLMVHQVVDGYDQLFLEFGCASVTHTHARVLGGASDFGDFEQAQKDRPATEWTHEFSKIEDPGRLFPDTPLTYGTAYASGNDELYSLFRSRNGDSSSNRTLTQDTEDEKSPTVISLTREILYYWGGIFLLCFKQNGSTKHKFFIFRMDF